MSSVGRSSNMVGSVTAAISNSESRSEPQIGRGYLFVYSKGFDHFLLNANGFG